MTAFWSVEEARRRAAQRLPRLIFDFIDGAGGDESAAALNREALVATRLQPRVLENVTQRSLKTAFLGTDYAGPFGVAPMGMCNLTHPGADAALARLAADQGLPVALSCAGSTSLEDFNRQADGKAWFQLYVGQSDALAEEMIARAEAAAYDTLILTVDVPVVAARRRDARNGFRMPFKMRAPQFLDFALHPGWSLRMLMAERPRPMTYETSQVVETFDRTESRGSADWAFLARLRDRWPRKLIVKGLTHGEDARRMRDLGADALWVSNHGGRQLGSAPSSLSALSAVREAVGLSVPLIFDSGVRDGEDIVKGLASGADLVMLGRPFLYAIGAAGPAGAAHLVDLLSREVSATLAQVGRTSIQGIDGRILAPPGPYKAGIEEHDQTPTIRLAE